MLNCRRISGLLSAFLDGELTGEEMLAIRAHLDSCDSCEREHQSLRETKLLLASLAYKAPRAELEALLVRHGISGGASVPRAVEPNPGGLRPFPIAATMFLSLAGLWLASTALNAPGDAAGDFGDPVRPGYPVMAISNGFNSPVALAVPPPPAGWSLVPVVAGGPSVMPSDGGANYSPITSQVVVSPTDSPRIVSSYSVTTISDGRAQTVRFFSTSGVPALGVNPDRVVPIGVMPSGQMPRMVSFGIVPGGTFVSVRASNR